MAGSFAHKALQAFSKRIAPRLRLSQPFFSSAAELDSSAAKLAESIGIDAATLPIADGLNFITSIYPILLAPSDRSNKGAFYTPVALVNRLLDQATEEGVDWKTVRVLDPAAGGGAFLIHSALRMRDALQSCEPSFVLAQIETRLLGLELDPVAAGLARNSLQILLSDLSAASKRAFRPNVRVCDTLDEEPDPSFDLVIGNPPYGRVTLTDEQRHQYSRSLYGHANLYGVFTDIALRWTRDGGLIAYLTPTSFLAGQYFAALRNLLATEAPPASIDLVHARSGVFEDVLQETMLAVYRKSNARRRSRPQIHYLNVHNEREADVTRNGTVGLPTPPSSPWFVPRNSDHSFLISRLEAMPVRLGDWGYSVSTGPLVWNRFKPQLRHDPNGEGVHPLIWAEAVAADGRFIFRAEKKNHAPYFKLKRGDEWLVVRGSCVLLQRTTAKEQARRLIAAELPAEFVEKNRGVVVENHLNMIRPGGMPKVSTGVVAAIFNSQVVDQVFRCMSGSVAVSAFELEAMPLPPPEALQRLTELVTRKANSNAIDRECARLYGLDR
jgi:adenine-specific DNA-methyltransferase